jgi:cytoskeletal protein RodZ
MESDQEPLSFGRYLQAIRLEKKISLEQVSQQTRIGLGNLLLIEQEDHERLPAVVYVKGFLRSYAKAIGADGDEVIRRYESRLDVVEKISSSEFSSKKTARGIWRKLLVSVVLLICIIGLSIFAVVLFRQAPDVDTALEQMSAAEKKQAVDTPAEKQSLETDIKPAKAVPEKFLLHVTAVEDTWLKVIMDEKEPAEYSLKSGDRIELEAAAGFNLLIGNAGGVKITLNDIPVSIPGKSGEVVTIELP